MKPEICFSWPGKFRAAGTYKTLPSASQTPPLKGEAFPLLPVKAPLLGTALGCCSLKKAPLPGELAAQRPEGFAKGRRTVCRKVFTPPSASQTPPLRGEAFLYRPAKAPLPGELDAQRPEGVAKGRRTVSRKVFTLPSASQTPTGCGWRIMLRALERRLHSATAALPRSGNDRSDERRANLCI